MTMHRLWMCMLLCLWAYKPKVSAEDYTGYKVYKVVPETQEDMDILQKIEMHFPDMDFFSAPHILGEPVLLMAPPNMQLRMDSLLKDRDIQHSVFIEDMQKEIDKEKSRLAARFADSDGFDFDLNDFNTFTDIVEQLEVYASQCPRRFECEVRTIGETYEGRPIQLIQITRSQGNREAIWLDSTIHAREWLSTATMLRILDHLITGYGNDDSVTALLDRYDFYIVPVVNPDGYVYSWESSRLQRKNRSPNSGSSCLGTDLNRNFDWKWREQGVSANPCSDLYGGDSAASELETQAVVKEVTRLSEAQKITTLWSFHTFGRYTLFSWANSIPGQGCERSDDYNDLLDVGNAFTNEVERVGGQNWRCGTVCEILYEATGATIDWAKGRLGLQYTYTPELRGSYFIVDPSEIPKSFDEVWAGLVVAIQEIEAKHK